MKPVVAQIKKEFIAGDISYNEALERLTTQIDYTSIEACLLLDEWEKEMNEEYTQDDIDADIANHERDCDEDFEEPTVNNRVI